MSLPGQVDAAVNSVQELPPVWRDALSAEFERLGKEVAESVRRELKNGAFASQRAESKQTIRAESKDFPSGMSTPSATLRNLQPVERRLSEARHFLPLRGYRAMETRGRMGDLDEVTNQGLPANFDGTRRRGLGNTSRDPCRSEPQSSGAAGDSPALQSTLRDGAWAAASPRASPRSQPEGHPPLEEGQRQVQIEKVASEAQRESTSFMKLGVNKTSVTTRGLQIAEEALGVTEREQSNMHDICEEWSPLRRKCANIVRSQRFEIASMVVIFMNAASLGWQADVMAKQMLSYPPPVFRVCDVLFMCLFIVEVALRMFVYRSRYFKMWGWGWHLLDVILIITQLFEEILLFMHGFRGDGGLGVLQMGTLLRVVRMLRAIRVLRVMHVMKFVEDLRLIVSCLVHSFRAFFWSFFLLGLLVYILAVNFTQTALYFRLSKEPDDPGSTELKRWYGNILRTMLSILAGFTGGVDWAELVDPLTAYISPVAGVMFVGVIAFALLGLMNVITATFVHQAIERAQMVQEVQKVSQAGRLFKKIDIDMSGVITLEEIEGNLASKEVQEFFRSIDVDVTEAKTLFKMLDASDNGEIDFNEFIGGLLRLQGPAKAIDLVLVMRELTELFDGFVEIMRVTARQIDGVSPSD